MKNYNSYNKKTNSLNNGYNKYGFDLDGFNKYGLDKDGFDRDGFNREDLTH